MSNLTLDLIELKSFSLVYIKLRPINNTVYVLQVLLVYDLKENLRTIHIYNSFVNCRFVGSIWLWMRAIVWRTTTVNWPKHWTPIILHRSVSYWLVHHFRIDCLSCGLWWISFSPVFLIPRPLSNHGLTHRSRWQERKLNWMKKKLFLLSVVCTRYLFFLLRDLIDIYSIAQRLESFTNDHLLYHWTNGPYPTSRLCVTW